MMGASTTVPDMNAIQAAKMEQLNLEWFEALDRFHNAYEIALKRWQAQKPTQIKETTLEQWSKKNCPMYIYYQDQLDSTNARRNAYARQFQGADSLLIQEKLDNTGPDKAENHDDSFPG
jgi:hypothetical protein